MAAWTINEWIILALAFLLGLFIGMFLLAGGKWKRRYHDEVRRREELERERKHWEARSIATNARSDTPLRDEPPPHR
jgi:uncharacterized membrane-anchored protein YhcB (DUF1043 family)